jgi:hypothetical protein
MDPHRRVIFCFRTRFFKKSGAIKFSVRRLTKSRPRRKTGNDEINGSSSPYHFPSPGATLEIIQTTCGASCFRKKKRERQIKVLSPQSYNCVLALMMFEIQFLYSDYQNAIPLKCLCEYLLKLRKRPASQAFCTSGHRSGKTEK